MNHVYKTVFNKSTQTWMAVCEYARSVGCGSASGGSKSVTRSVVGSITFLSFAVLMALQSAHANTPTTIIADKSADKALQPIVLNTASGVVSVNIATPNARGLSNNHYSQFDVGSTGAVLNNNRKAVNTQIAGFVAANPYMARGEASTILNQVNSNNPSHLGGFIEVAGKKADVIIANPSGLVVNGAGFINAGNVHLAAANSQVNQGQVTGYEVGAGHIAAHGKLNLQGTDYAALIAKTAQINDEIYAGKQLDVILGENSVSLQDGDLTQLTATHKNNGSSSTNQTGTAPTLALDISSLGGMYAGKIHLIGTDKGFGVNNQGVITATGSGQQLGAGTLTLDSQGNLINTGKILAKDAITINTHDNTTQNDGTLLSEQADVAINTASLNNTGIIHSTQTAKIAAKQAIENLGSVYGGVLQVNTDKLNNTGQLIQTGTGKLDITTDTLINTDKAVIGQSLYGQTTVPTPSTPSSDQSAGSISSELADNTAGSTGNVGTGLQPPALSDSGANTQTKPVPTARGHITATSSIHNTGSQALITATGDIGISANQTSNTKQASIDVQSLNTNTLANTDSKIALDDINCQLTRFDNSQGSITARDGMVIDSGSDMINTGGQLSATDAVALSAVGVLDNTQGVIVSGGDTAISADGVNNQAGAIMSTGNVSIASKDKLTNDKGVISAQANTTVSVGTALSNHDGNIFGNQHLTIHSQDLTNSGQVYGGKSTTLTALRTLDNTQTGLIASGGDTTIRAHTITHAGSIIAGMDREGKLGQPANLSIQSTGNLVSTGTHIATQAMVMTGNMLDLSDSHSEAVNINLNSQTDVNTTNATAIAADTLHISTPGQLNNTQGQLSAKQLMIDGSKLINHQGNISHSGTQALTLSFNQGLDNSQGNISSNSQVLDINTGTAALNNQQGSIAHTGSTLTVSTQHLGNHQGKLLSTGNQSLTVATDINNSQGIIQADALAIAAQSINNHQGKLLSTANQSLSTQEDINNHQGIIQASGFTIDAKALNNHQGSVFATDETAQSRITLTGNLSNTNADTQAATITTLGALAISANTLDNTGQISTKTLTVDANTINNSGSISSQEATSIHAKDALNNRATGSLYAGTDLTLNSQGRLSHHGKALAANQLSATAATLDLTDSHNEADSISYDSQGDITHHNATSLAAQNIRINNTQGVLSNQAGNLTAKTVDIHTESLQNGGVITAKEMTISQTKDYTHTSDDTLTADTLTFTTQGNFSNQHSFGATDSLTLTAASIHNHQDATITSSNTTLHSQTNITNQGLINGDTTIVKAANTINNLAGGRIYGTQLAIQADTLNNTPAKAANQQTNQENDHHTAPVIAARERLDIGVNTLNNNPNPDRAGKFNEDFDNQALITSLGSLHIGGSLDDNHQSTGKAQTVVNKGATIESAGQMQVDTKTLLNTNADFKKHTVEVVAESARNQTLYRNREQSGAAPAIQKSTNTADLGNKPMAGLFDCPEGSECIVNYDYDSTIWSYFKIDAPKQPVPDIKAKDLLDEPELPKNETAESCALAEASNQACTQYNKELANYTKVMGPLLKWEEDNAAAIESLELAIREYNRQFTTNKSDVDLALNIYTTDEAYLGPTSRKGAPTGALYVKQANGSYQRVGEEIDEITVDFVVYEDKTLASDPARMVAGQNLVIHGDTLINDKSQMNAGAGFAVIGDTVIQTPDNGLYGEKTKVTENGRYVSRTVEPSGLGGRRHKRVDIGSGAFTQSFAPLATYELPILNATINKTPSVMTIDQSALAGGDVETVLAALKANQAALSLDAKQQLSKLLAAKEQGQAVDEAILSELTKALSQSVDAKQASVISADLSQLTIPSSALYIINADDPNLPLVQTDPAFTDYKQWLSSDYMLKALQSDPNHIHKRLSDGYGEQERIKDQYYLLTGRHINTDYSSNEEAYKTLMDNGITAAKQFGYTLGTALTAEQMANLTTDIVWLVKQSITYTTKDKDGNSITKTQDALVPKLYLRSANIATGTLTPDGRYAAISAKNMDLQLTGNLDNNGNLVAHNAANIAANTITNTNRIQGEFVAITAAKDINNLGGTLAANTAMTLSAGNNIINQSQTTTHHNKQGQSSSSNTAITRIATIRVGDGLKDQTDDNGNPLTTLSVQAGNYVLNQGSNIHSGGNTQITAQNGINITALTTSNHISAVADPNNYFNYSQSTDVGSTITSAGNLTIATTGKGAGINIQGSHLNATGATALIATGDISITEGRATQSLDTASKFTDKGLVSKKTTQTAYQMDSNASIQSMVGGENILIKSGGNTQLTGVEAKATETIRIETGGHLIMDAAKDTLSTKTSSSENSKWLGATVDKGDYTHAHERVDAITTTLQAKNIATQSTGSTLLEGTQFHYSDNATVASGGKLYLQAAISGTSEHITSNDNYVVWQKAEDSGSIKQTATLPSFVGNNKPTIIALDGVEIQIPISQQEQKAGITLQEQIDTLIQQPEYSYLNQFIDKQDATWQEIILAEDSWDYEQEGLTPAAAALISIAVGIATSGVGAGLLGTTGAATTAMANAAFSSLASQASVTLINNKGNVAQTLKDLGKSDTVKSMAQAAITAGVTASLDQIIVNTTNIDISASAGFDDKLARGVIQGTGHALTESLMHGTSLEDSLKNHLTNQLVDAAAASVYQNGVKPLNNNDTQHISNAVHKLAAGLTGCVAAKAKDESCESAAVGAIIGEMVGDWMANKYEVTMDDGEKILILSDEETQKILNTAKLTAGSVALLYGFDVDTAVGSAGEAVENNALLKPVDIESFHLQYTKFCSPEPSAACNSIIHQWKYISYEHAGMTSQEIAEWEKGVTKIIEHYNRQCKDNACRNHLRSQKYRYMIEYAGTPEYLYQLESSLITYTHGAMAAVTVAGHQIAGSVVEAYNAVSRQSVRGGNHASVKTTGHATTAKSNNASSPKLSSPNPIHIKGLRSAYEDVISGKETPNLDRNGIQKIYQGRENPNWKGATEWLVPNSEGRHHRILKMPNGRMGYVIDHNYNNIRPFPAPWYPDGGVLTKPVR